MAEQLTHLLAKDLDDGFTELVRIYAGGVRAYLLRVTGSAVEADDLGQETFLRAYTALRGYSQESRRELRPRAWLMTIAVNVWRNHVRTTMRRPATTAWSEEAWTNWEAKGPGPEERAFTADDRTRLVSALARLPERHRTPVVLRFVVGLSNAEVAEVQSCPVGTVKAQVSRALGSLRDVLAADNPAPGEVTT